MDDFDRADLEHRTEQVLSEHAVVHAAQLQAIHDQTYLDTADVLGVPKWLSRTLMLLRSI